MHKKQSLQLKLYEQCVILILHSHVEFFFYVDYSLSC